MTSRTSRLFQIFRNDFVNLLWIVMRVFRLNDLSRFPCCSWDRTEDVAHNTERFCVIFGAVIGNAGNAAMYIGSAELFGSDYLAGGRLHQRRTAKENRALIAHDD